jgi:hypothetical protein
MHEKLRTVAAFVLVLSAMTLAGAQEPTAAQQVVERFVEALSSGSTTTANELLSGTVAWSEDDLFWRTAIGPAAQVRVNQLVRADVRIEMEVLAVVGDDQVVIAAERMWGDFVPEGMAPLRSTTVYVVESGWLVGITRVLAAEQRDALARAALADTVWEEWGGVYHRFDADGTYRNFDNLASARSGRNFYFSGSYRFERGVLTLVADADSRICDPGDSVVMQSRMVDQETWINLLVPDRTACAYYRTALSGQPVVAKLLADE